MTNDKNAENKKSSIFSIEKMRENPWMLASLFLGIVLVLVLVLKGGGMTGNVVSSEAAAQNLISFVKEQSGATPELVSSEKNGSFYQVIINYQGMDIPVYVTLDGKYLVSGLIPLETNKVNFDNSERESETQEEIAKSDKPVVELFVMSLCPYGLQMEKGILPVVNLLKDKIDFSVKFVSYAMHDKVEIDENTRQYCIQKEQKNKFINYLACYLEKGDSAKCLASAGIDATKLNSCIAAADKEFKITENYNDKDSWLNGYYPPYNVNAEECERYGVQGSPTLVINGVQVSSARDSASLLKLICSAFTSAPAECSQKLSSTAPSAGFGYSASASGSTTASCS
ncbi:MAG: hypothetical protein QXS38_01475 [Candidatus Pacearchaeota archaeon]